MSPTRRQFLHGCGAGAVAWAATRLIPGEVLVSRVEAAELSPDRLAELAAFALERARKAGATYADIRINRYRSQVVTLRSQPDFGSAKLNHVPAVSDAETCGFGIRVLAKGAWGFAAAHGIVRDDVARAAYRDVYRTPIVKDPFDVPLGDKLDLLRAVNEAVKQVEGVFSVSAVASARLERRFFASTEGSVIEQHVYQVAPEFTATAVERGRKTKTRTYRPHCVTAGWEAVERADLLGHARRVGQEAVAHLAAPSVEPGPKDLVLLPTHLALTIHESIGHSTELDRALGFEANFAGTSFLTPDKLGRFRVGSEIVNFNGDRVRPEGMSTCGYDDDGVKTRQFKILDRGVFVGYQTIRDQAHLIGQTESTGCCYADSYASVPFQRMPNVWLEPSREPVTLDDLVAGVDDGVLIDGRGSYSIDQQRYNFQFGGDAFWEIKGGKVGAMIADVAYQNRTPDFWQACDGIGGEATWENVGLNSDGKGQPQQVNAMSHGCAPARFRQIRVLRTE